MYACLHVCMIVCKYTYAYIIMTVFLEYSVLNLFPVLCNPFNTFLGRRCSFSKAQITNNIPLKTHQNSTNKLLAPITF